MVDDFAHDFGQLRDLFEFVSESKIHGTSILALGAPLSSFNTYDVVFLVLDIIALFTLPHH